jgi:hypothetical protein
VLDTTSPVAVAACVLKFGAAKYAEEGENGEGIAAGEVIRLKEFSKQSKAEAAADKADKVAKCQSGGATVEKEE